MRKKTGVSCGYCVTKDKIGEDKSENFQYVGYVGFECIFGNVIEKQISDNLGFKFKKLDVKL